MKKYWLDDGVTIETVLLGYGVTMETVLSEGLTRRSGVQGEACRAPGWAGRRPSGRPAIGWGCESWHRPEAESGGWYPPASLQTNISMHTWGGSNVMTSLWLVMQGIVAQGIVEACLRCCSRICNTPIRLLLTYISWLPRPSHCLWAYWLIWYPTLHHSHPLMHCRHY